jgi:16S rRNA (uracil1498-N3)-methyltransferase
MLNLFFVPSISDSQELVVTGDEAHHAVHVLRLQVGEELLLADGTGSWVRARIEATSKRSFTVEVVERGQAEPLTIESTGSTGSQLHELIVVQGLMKFNRVNEALELLTVAGVDRIIPWESERSIAKWQSDTGAKWMSATVAAAKQARRFTLPQIEDPISTQSIGKRFGADANLFVLHEEATTKISMAAKELRSGPIVLVIGPEGGLSPAEVTELEIAGGQVVRLGRNILRSAHAGFAGLSAISTLHGVW